MAEYLVIRLGSNPELGVSWITVDDGGTRKGGAAQGSLGEAAAQAGEREVIVLVPSASVLSTTVDLPIRSGPRLLAALPYALEEQLADDVDKLHFAAGVRREDHRLPVAVASREAMDGWIETLSGAGIVARRLVAESSGLASIPGTLSMLLGDGEVMFNDGEDTEFVLQGVSPVEALTIAGIMNSDRRDARHLLVCCEPADEQRFADDWRVLRKELASVDINLLPDGILPRLAVTVASGRGVNLLQGRYGEKSDLRALFQPWRYAAVLLLALGAVAIGAKAADLFRLNRDEAALVAQFTEEYRQIRPDDTREIVDPISIVNSLRRSVGAPIAAGVFLPSLQELGKALQQYSGAEIEAISYRAGVIDVRLTAPDVATLDNIQRAVSNSGRFAASIQSTDQVGDKISSRIQIREAGA
jgi:general secretion pathway protein L